MLRGILVALVGQHPVLWNVSRPSNHKPSDSQFRTAKDKILEVLSGEVATVLQNTDAKMNGQFWKEELFERASV